MALAYYGGVRFLVEFIRRNPRLGPFTQSQWTVLVLLLLTLSWWLRRNRSHRAPAIDPVTGRISQNASTFWSTRDGGAVDRGGVGELLANRDPDSRAMWTNSGDGGALEEFSSVNLDAEAFG